MIKTGKYRHFKGGEYEVLGVANHSETLEKMVVYRALYGEGEIWVRPLSMWNETVERDGKTFPRFTYVGDEKQEKKDIEIVYSEPADYFPEHLRKQYKLGEYATADEEKGE